MPARGAALRGRAAAFALAAAVACTQAPARPAGPTPGTGASTVTLSDLACGLPRPWLVRTLRGYQPGRSGEVQIVPAGANVMGPGLPHAGPADHLQRVPLFLYGPGLVRAAGAVDRPVTLADVAPTEAELLGFPLAGVDGKPLEEALPASADRPRPRLIVTMVWDAAGTNVLEQWPESWPYLRSLIPEGTWYERATIGSSPSQTAQIHATIGTGVFPARHGLVGHRMRVGGGILAPWADSPGYIERPTLADLYDRAMENRPVVGAVASLSIQLGMLGHGAYLDGGDRDLAVIRQRQDAETLGAEAETWTISDALAPYYVLPPYVNGVGGLEADAEALDREDGALDGRWRGNDIETLLSGYDTPARIPYETRVVEEVIRREGFGADDVPDLLFVNYKIVDYISHAWDMSSPEMADALVWHDRSLREFLGFLDAQVGAGRWALVLTADHGATPPLEGSGGLEISPTAVRDALQETFDRDGDDARAIEFVTHTQIYVDEEELAEQGGTLGEVARAVMSLTAAEVAPEAPAPRAAEPAFRAAYPSSLLGHMPCLEAVA